MKTSRYALTPAEQTVARCADLYAKYGYRRFLMNKFEDYALYADNKNFLVDQRLLTFTDGSGLKALKPDVTLSIVKNTARDGRLPVKVFYNETVYRVKKGEREFSELRQMGVEHIGDDSPYACAEIVCLAKASLDLISPDNILDLSHMGILMPLIERACQAGIDREQLIGCITQKNADGVATLLAGCEGQNPLSELVGAYLPLPLGVARLQELLPDCPAVGELAELCLVLEAMDLAHGVYLDLSLMHDFGYYNGLIFKGYLKDVPVSVLSGGRYDPLLTRFGLQTAAMGFAIYLDYIEYNEQLEEKSALLLYTKQDSAAAVARATAILTGRGYSTMACMQAPDHRSFEKVFTVKEVLA